MIKQTLKPIPAVPLPASLKIKAADWPCDFVMLSIGKLFIRNTYQRELTTKSARTVIAIAKDFAWSKFGCLVVRQIDGEDRYEVIDGQHRAIAAKMVRASAVPAIVVKGAAADAFIGINGVRTALSALAIFRAELEAKNEDALAIMQIAEAADVRIRASQAAGTVPPGQSVAIGAIRSVFKIEGPRRLEWAFRAIRLAESNATPLDPSMLTAPNIRGAAEAIRVLADGQIADTDVIIERVAKALNAFDDDVLREKIAEKKALTGEGVWKCLAGVIVEEVLRDV